MVSIRVELHERNFNPSEISRLEYLDKICM